MNLYLTIALALAVAIPTGIVSAYAGRRCDELDVGTGRRTEFDVAQDYGSNHGFYWPWTPLYIASLLCCVLASGFLFLMFAIWVLYG